MDMTRYVGLTATKVVVSVLLTCFLAFGNGLAAYAASAQVINSRANVALTEFRENVRGANDVLSKASGVLVFPRVYQAGLVIGGEYGQGALIVDNQVVGYYELISASAGFQTGAQTKAMIIAFMNDEALTEFIQGGGWEFGADASAVVLTLGAEGSIDTATLNEPVLVFVVDQRGLMYNLSLEGTRIKRIQR
jgi:lipid-binding SYLF domain-containing protein